MDAIDTDLFLEAHLKTRQQLIALNGYRNIYRASQALHMTQPAARCR
jgi:hypothetical protein